MNYPLVSIVIPSYNHEKYVLQALNSILDDSYPNKEIVIINDGSTDSSNDIITKWINENSKNVPIIYKNRGNRGLCATLNELIHLSAGKYVLLLASDDALYGDTITDRVEILENNESRGKLVLVSDALVMDDNGNHILQSSMTEYNKGNKAKYATEDGIMEEVIKNPSVSGATCLINRKIYSLIGYYREDLKAEDWYFYQRAAASKAILFWDEPVSLYRVHTANSSGQHVPIAKQLGLTKSIIKTYYLNYNSFPTLRFKFLSLKQLFKFILIYYKLKTRALIN